MNIGDYVYLYLFDLEKSINNMNRLRDDRFGRIVNRTILHNENGNHVVQYNIELLCNKKIIQYRSDNLSTNIMQIDELMKAIRKMDIPTTKKELLLIQISEVIKS